MPAERFFIDAPLKGTLKLEGDELHHLNVIRAYVGDEIELVNGKGALAKATLVALSKKEAQLSVVSVTETPHAARLILAVPLMRPSKLEFVVEKGTELGADAFWFYQAVHSEKDSLSPNQLQRLRHLTVAAMKQCGRLSLPPIQQVSFHDLFPHDMRILFGDPVATKQPTASTMPTLVITGPERGFADQELKELKAKAEPISLGIYTLRAETAPLAASVLLAAR